MSIERDTFPGPVPEVQELTLKDWEGFKLTFKDVKYPSLATQDDVGFIAVTVDLDENREAQFDLKYTDAKRLVEVLQFILADREER